MAEMAAKDKLIVALDVDSEKKALTIIDMLKKDVKFFKIGLELFTSCGPGIVEAVKERGCEIFLDLKLHDIPNTVARTAVSLTGMGVYMFNVHALGGYEMMKKSCEEAHKRAAELKIRQPKIIAVTVLTSMDEESLKRTGFGSTIRDEVLILARLAKDAGLDGVVASPSEIVPIKEACGKDFLIVTPGVRPKGSENNDQRRIAAPRDAVRDGADFIVVGRPITGAVDPVAAAINILKEMGS